MDIDLYFERKFSFVKEDDWELPPVNLLYQEDVWDLQNMKEMKAELNKVKSLLNDKGELWQQHTSRINKAGLVIEYIKKTICPEILTQAWCKFYEILTNYKIIPTDVKHLKTVHLCEAPGGFISALNYYMYLHHPEMLWDWVANTLNPYYEGHNIKNVVVDDRLLFPTMKNWYFGRKDTGDITDSEYLKEFCIFLESNQPISLITADGSINCIDNPAEQELATSDLHFAELLIAIHNLSKRGTFILKKFTFFECITICTMYFLNCIFEKVHVFKPFTSKAGNSEVYVICLGYLGNEKLDNHLFTLFKKYVTGRKNDKAIFSLSSIPESFISQSMKCSKYFFTLQKEAIQENLRLYSLPLSSYEEKCNYIKKNCAEYYLKKCEIFLDENYQLAHVFPAKKQIRTSFYDKQKRSCKSLYFQVVGETFENLNKSKLMIFQEEILDIEKRLNACFLVNIKHALEDIEWHFVWKEIINRMKSKSYQNWVSFGQKVNTIRNSKFCNPMLLYLWNKLSYNTEVTWENHAVKTCYSWDVDNISLLLKKKLANDVSILSILESRDDNEEDSLWLYLEKHHSKTSICFAKNEKDSEKMLSDFLTKSKIIYINTTCWVKSLHQEVIIKERFTTVLCSSIKIMNTGDFLLICVQSLLMRYTAGLFFLLLSLFEKFICLLPSTVAPAACGQLWIFKNFRRPEWTERVLKYLETIPKLDLPDKSEEILQLVPIASLCGGPYYEFLLNLNNEYMLQRLRNLISVEKNRIKIKT